MKEFIENWKTNKKFKAKIQLSLYVLLFVFVSAYAITSARITKTPNEPVKDNYDYKMIININDKIYNYAGKKEKDQIIINKTIDGVTKKYVYKENGYYLIEENVFVSVMEEEVYDTIKFDYLSLSTINKYLQLSTKIEDKNLVYLKDIIIGENSEEYITIEQNNGTYNIDYTALMKLFHNDIEKLTVEIIIE